jgi:uncharacterized protein YndB with AHSA1/START domain
VSVANVTRNQSLHNVKETVMTRMTIERELSIAASPEIVYEVISSPEHLREWWPDDAEIAPVVGATGRVVFGDPASPDAKVERLTVVEAEEPRRFAFRWVYAGSDSSNTKESLLVTFDLVPSGEGTLLRFTESGFDEREWDTGTAEQAHRDHVTGWDTFLPRLVSYAGQLVPRP